MSQGSVVTYFRRGGRQFYRKFSASSQWTFWKMVDI